MTCQQVQTSLSFYLYGELDFAQEEAFERHLENCALCQRALSREKEWHAAVNAGRQDVPFELLSECRRNLRITLRSGRSADAGSRWWSRLLPSGFSATRWSVQIAAASFLVFAGFTAARLMDSGRLPTLSSTAGVTRMGLLDTSNAHVRDIEPAGQNGVRIVIDRTQQQEVTGTLNDDAIRQWLLAAMQDPSDPGIRVDSVELLQRQSGTDVRDALINTAKTDPNAAVRIKALEGLRQFANESATREAIEFVLKHDNNADVRSEAIDMLLPPDLTAPAIAPDVLKTLQDVLNSEQENDYVRSRSLQVLRTINASGPVY
jgi:hypothetical protein